MKLRLTPLLVVAIAILVCLAAPGAAQNADPRGTRSAARTGGLIGLAIGGIGLPTFEYVRMERVCGPVRGTIHACDDEWDPTLLVMMYGGIGGAIGAGIGTFIGSRIDRHRAHGNDRLPRRFVVSPIVGTMKRGMAVSYSF